MGILYVLLFIRKTFIPKRTNFYSGKLDARMIFSSRASLSAPRLFLERGGGVRRGSRRKGRTGRGRRRRRRGRRRRKGRRRRRGREEAEGKKE